MSNTIRNIIKVAGATSSWREGEETFTVTRNTNGSPNVVSSTVGRWPSQSCTFTYSNNEFTGIGGQLNSLMLQSLIDEAIGVARMNPARTTLVDLVTGASFLRGPLVGGLWMTIPPIHRLRLTGTGTVTLDAKDSLGIITLGVAIYTISNATNQIEFPYAGDNSVAIRATMTGTATSEVI